MTDRAINRKFNEARVFLDWYITRLVLNGLIDETKCAKHQIYIHSTEEMKGDYVDTNIYHDWREGLNLLQHWQKIHKIQYWRNFKSQ